MRTDETKKMHSFLIMEYLYVGKHIFEIYRSNLC